jgi:hypothetical protein
MKTVKIDNIEALRARKAELRNEIKHMETDFSFRVYFLKKNIPSILFHQLFPSNKPLNERLVQLFNLGFELIVSKVMGEKTGTGENKLERFFSWLSDKFQRRFGKRKEDASKA